MSDVLEYRSGPPVTLTEERIVRGVAVPFGEWSHPIADARGRQFRERWQRGSGEWSSDTTLVLLHREAGGLPLARVGANTLNIWEDERGVHFEAELPRSAFGKDVEHALVRGDLDGSVSVAFRAARQSWERRTSQALRTIERGVIGHIAFVPAGAYAGARSTLSGAS